MALEQSRNQVDKSCCLRDDASRPLVLPLFNDGGRPKNELTVPQLLKECVIATSGDTVSGAAMFQRRLRDEFPSFYVQKQDESMLYYCQDQYAAARRSLRTSIASLAYVPPTSRQQPLSGASIQAAHDVWFDWPVSPGVLLREAKRDDLTEQAFKYLRDASVYERRGKWLAAIADRIPDQKKTVSDVLDEQTIAQMAESFGVSIK